MPLSVWNNIYPCFTDLIISSKEFLPGPKKVIGSGMCGKGHKEWVYVSDGGPYLKAEAKLG